MISKLNLENFQIIREMEGNSQNKIYLVRQKSDQQLYVLKKIKISRLDLQLREIQAQKRLKHKNIVQLLEYEVQDSYINLLIEFAEHGDLFEFINSLTSIRESQILNMFYKIVMAVQYIHENGFIHRDIKPENVLIGKDGEPKLADFGSAVSRRQARDTFCGTYEYMAPEVYRRQRQSEKVDIWALGVLLFEMTHNRVPFKTTDVGKIEYMVGANKLPFNPQISVRIRSIIQKLLKVRPSDRPTGSQVLRLPELDVFYLSNFHVQKCDPEILESLKIKINSKKTDLTTPVVIKAKEKSTKIEKIKTKPKEESEQKVKKRVNKNHSKSNHCLGQAEELKKEDQDQTPNPQKLIDRNTENSEKSAAEQNEYLLSKKPKKQNKPAQKRLPKKNQDQNSIFLMESSMFKTGNFQSRNLKISRTHLNRSQNIKKSLLKNKNSFLQTSQHKKNFNHTLQQLRKNFIKKSVKNRSKNNGKKGVKIGVERKKDDSHSFFFKQSRVSFKQKKDFIKTINQLRKDINKKNKRRQPHFKKKIRIKPKPIQQKSKKGARDRNNIANSRPKIRNNMKLRSIRVPKFSHKAKSQDFSKKSDLKLKNIDSSLAKQKTHLDLDSESYFLSPNSHNKFTFSPINPSSKRRKNLKSKKMQTSIYNIFFPKATQKKSFLSQVKALGMKSKTKIRNEKSKFLSQNSLTNLGHDSFKIKIPNPHKKNENPKIAKLRLKPQRRQKFKNPKIQKKRTPSAKQAKHSGSARNGFKTGEYLLGAENVSEASNPMYYEEEESSDNADVFRQVNEMEITPRKKVFPLKSFQNLFSRSMERRKNVSEEKNYLSQRVFGVSHPKRVFKMRFK